MIVKTITELYKIFHQLEKALFDIPLEEPVILIQSTKKKILGTCSVNKIWEKKNDEKISKYEITVVAESLKRPTEEIVETLLHEMVHLYCSLKNIKDTSNNFNYHNNKYKEEAEAHGLEVSKGKTVGWGYTKLQEKTKTLIKTFQIDESAFEYYRKASLYPAGKKIEYNKYECPECGLKIALYKKVNIKCGDCEKTMEIKND
jgi:ribosomal protein S27AE